MKEKTLSDIKKEIKEKKRNLEYYYSFIEEIDSITDIDVIVEVEYLIKVKHDELSKGKQINKTLVEETKIEQPTQEPFRAKFHKDEFREKNGKTCFKCNQKKPIEDFYTSKTNGDGLQSYCKQCQKIEARKSQINKRKNGNKSGKQISLSTDAKDGDKGVFIPTYDTVIHKEEIDNVLKAIKKENTTETNHTDFICNETKMKDWRVRAVMLYLREMGRIKKTYKGKKLTYKVV